MYSPYISPSQNDFDNIFSPPMRGGGMSDINIYRSPRAFQRGGGLFSFLGRIIRGSIPILRNLLLPEIPRLISNVRDDVNSGINLRESIKNQGVKSIKNISKKTYDKLRGAGRKKKTVKRNKSRKKNVRKVKTKNKKAIKKSKDIFSSY